MSKIGKRVIQELVEREIGKRTFTVISVKAEQVPAKQFGPSITIPTSEAIARYMDGRLATNHDFTLTLEGPCPTCGYCHIYRLSCIIIRKGGWKTMVYCDRDHQPACQAIDTSNSYRNVRQTVAKNPTPFGVYR